MPNVIMIIYKFLISSFQASSRPDDAFQSQKISLPCLADVLKMLQFEDIN